jgi:hypothetical protein
VTTTTTQVITACCIRLGIPGCERYFRLLERNLIEDAVADRVIADTEVIGQLSQGWTSNGMFEHILIIITIIYMRRREKKKSILFVI